MEMPPKPVWDGWVVSVKFPPLEIPIKLTGPMLLMEIDPVAAVLTLSCNGKAPFVVFRVPLVPVPPLNVNKGVLMDAPTN